MAWGDLVELRVVPEHIAHLRHRARVPAAYVFVENRRVREHLVRRSYFRHVPEREVLVEELVTLERVCARWTGAKAVVSDIMTRLFLRFGEDVGFRALNV